MHVLTKIFIVLVALLDVMLVPLVVVYAKNEASFRDKYLKAGDELAAVSQTLKSAEINYGRQIESKQGEIKSLNEALVSLRSQVQEKNLQLARAESDLATTKSQQSQLNNQLKLLADSLDSSQQLTDQLVGEAGQLRTQGLQTLRQNAELQVAVQQSDRELEVLYAAVRSLKEEVQRLSEAQGKAIETIAKYVALRGELDEVTTGFIGEPIDRKVVTSIIDVRPSEGLMLAEIAAGQRDGVQKGWIMTIGDGNGNYIGRLRIIDVDISRSVGIAEKADGKPARDVRSGFTAYAFPN